MQLTYPPAYVYYPRISPDGTRVVYGSLDANGNRAAYVISIYGGVPRKIVENALFGANWSPDGNSVVANVASPPKIKNWGALQALETVDLRTGKISVIADPIARGGVWWASQNLLVAPDCGPSAKWQFLTYDFTTRKWSHLVDARYDHWMPSLDGQYLYYTTGLVDPKIMRVRFSDHTVEEITSLRDFVASRMRLLSPGLASPPTATLSLPATSAPTKSTT